MNVWSKAPRSDRAAVAYDIDPEDANLIAAAPELLVVAQFVVDSWPLMTVTGQGHELIEAARGAIAKASGAAHG